MNREQAIERATNLRKGTRVALQEKGAVTVGGETKEGLVWVHETYESVGAAKRRMRELGCGVALMETEKLPAEGSPV